jgi:hypothetical protein
MELRLAPYIRHKDRIAPYAEGVTDESLPELRASDADRERTAEVLRQAAGEGRLNVEELEERLNTTYASRTHRELQRLTADIVVSEAHAPAGMPRRMPIRQSAREGTKWLISVMGGHDRKGRWLVERRVNVVNVMGGSDLDLNDAELAGEYVEMTVFSLMGGASVRVPEGLNVEVSEFAFMGGNDVKLGNDRPDPGGPTLRLKLISIMGGSDVKRGRKLSRAERKRQRELDRQG